MRKRTPRSRRPKTPPCLIAVGMNNKHEGAMYCAIQAFRRGEGCENCRRRTAGGGDYVAWMEPPKIIAVECEFLIEVSE